MAWSFLYFRLSALRSTKLTPFTAHFLPVYEGFWEKKVAAKS